MPVIRFPPQDLSQYLLFRQVPKTVVRWRCKWLFSQFSYIVTDQCPLLSDMKSFLKWYLHHQTYSQWTFWGHISSVFSCGWGYSDRFFNTFSFLQATLFRIKYSENIHSCRQLLHFKTTPRLFSQLVPSLQKLAILATFFPYQNSPTLWIHLIFSNENRYIS